MIGNDHGGSATIADASGNDWLVLGGSEGAFNMNRLDSGSGSTDRATLAANNRAALKTAWLTNSTEGSGLDLLHLRAQKA